MQDRPNLNDRVLANLHQLRGVGLRSGSVDQRVPRKRLRRAAAAAVHVYNDKVLWGAAVHGEPPHLMLIRVSVCSYSAVDLVDGPFSNGRS
jgi:hypothetical protein